jgi:fructose-1,6-bisphosphatase II
MASIEHHVLEDRADDRPDRNLALELVRVTEAAALAAARWVGMGDKIAADQAAVDAMRVVLDTVQMDGVVVIGEGEKDEAPMLYNGEQIGDGSQPQVDIAVDPLEGTTLCAKGMPNALAVIALAEKGSMFDPGPASTCRRWPAARDRRLPGPRRAARRDRAADRQEEGHRRRRRHGRRPRPPAPRGRHPRVPRGRRARAAHLRRRRRRGDARGQRQLARRPAVGRRRHAGGRHLRRGAEVHGRPDRRPLWPRDEAERKAALDGGYDLDKQMVADDLITSDNCFFSATGVTDGDVLQGVRYSGTRSASTESLVMRSRSGTVRRISARHDRSKLRQLIGTERLG